MVSYQRLLGLPMDNWSSGFRIDAAFHPWGTLFNSVAPGRVDSGYASVELPCTSAYGFATIYAEPTAPRPDRPVTTVAYELAEAGTAPRHLFAELVKRLGPPDEVSRDDSPDSANESSVVLHADWKRGAVEIGLSLYGAPRPSDFGNGLGKLYLSWADRDAMAAPFLAAWRATNQTAVAAADGAEVRVFALQYALYDDDTAPLSPDELAFSTPDLLLTPPAIASRLGPTTFALWSDAAGAHCYLSTARSTVRLGDDGTATVQFLDIAPARGGGYAELRAGPWSVRDAHGSASIKRAVAALAALPGLTIDRQSGHDV